MDYIAFQGFIDERMRKEITLLESKGWQVRVVLNYPRSYRASVKGPETRVVIPFRVVSNALLNLLFFFPLFILLRYFPTFVRTRNQLDLLYVLNFPDSYALPYLLLAKLFAIPTIYEIRDPWKEYFLTESEPSARTRTRFRVTLLYMAFIEKIAILLASGVIFVNPSHEEVHGSDSVGKRTCIINNYSNYSYNEDLAARAQELERKLGLADSVVASYIASNFQPYRGVEILLESLNVVVARSPKLKLMIVGGSPDTLASLHRRIQALDLEKSCKVIGWIPGDELVLYYLISDFGVIPHRRTPATQLTAPIKLFDYMALGKPVILTSLREQSRYVFDGVNGLKVAPEDPADLGRAILELANDPVRLKQITARAVEEGKKYRFANLESIFLDFVSSLSKEN